MTDVPRISVLPDHVIDQIAAGEVVERPASVVKELIDNAIDAGARTITVDVDGGGRRMIRVADDGGGMSPAEAVLALARHATSKLRAVEDLYDLATLGFRGEALPAIASVSRLTLTTRRAGDLAGHRIVVEGGRVVDAGDAGAPVGTVVEVADLLFNVPARLKFLKGEVTEASHVTETVARLALAYPALHFRLRHGGRLTIDAPPVVDPIDRVHAVLGPRLAGAMIAVHGEETGVRVAAFLAPPELAQTTARGVQLFVGRRPVRDRNLLHAVAMGYGELVPRGRYPVAVVLLDVPAGAVDINVHPQKAEVRFADAPAVAAALRHVVRKGVAAAPWQAAGMAGAPIQIQAMASMAPPPIAAPAYAPTSIASRHAQLVSRSLGGGPAQGSLGLDEPALAAAHASRVDPSPVTWAERMRAQLALRADARAADSAAVRVDDEAIATGTGPTAAPCSGVVAGATCDGEAGASGPWSGRSGVVAGATGYFARLRYLGQLDRTYLVCEGDDELVLIDQHAAHERVELHRLRERAQASDPAVQRLLFPTTIEVPPDHLAAVAAAGAVLGAVGFEVEPFGVTTLAIKAVPAGLHQVDPAHVLRELLDDLVERTGDDPLPEPAAHHEDLLATIACHSVVRAGDLLGEHEARALLAAMDAVDFRQPGRHGRPVLLRLGVAELARRFGR
jgi:DNA mismatch repair protein MutL